MCALADDQPNPDADFLMKGGPPNPPQLKPFEAVVFAERRRPAPEQVDYPQCFNNVSNKNDEARAWLIELIQYLKAMNAVRIQVILGDAANLGLELLSTIKCKGIESVVHSDWQTQTRLNSLALLSFSKLPKRTLLIDANTHIRYEKLLSFRRFPEPCIVQCDIHAEVKPDSELVHFNSDHKLMAMGRDLPHNQNQGVSAGLIKLDDQAMTNLLKVAMDPILSDQYPDIPHAISEIAKEHPIHVLIDDRWQPLYTVCDLQISTNSLQNEICIPDTPISTVIREQSSPCVQTKPNPIATTEEKFSSTELKPFEAVVFAERRRHSPESGAQPQCFFNIDGRPWLANLIEILTEINAVRIQIILGQSAEMGRLLVSEMRCDSIEIITDPNWQTHTRLNSLACLTFDEPLPKRTLLIDGNSYIPKWPLLEFRRFPSPCAIQADLEARFKSDTEIIEFDADFQMLRMGRDLPPLDAQAAFTGLIKLDDLALADLLTAARDPESRARLVDLPGALTELAKIHPIRVLNENRWHPLHTAQDLKIQSILERN